MLREIVVIAVCCGCFMNTNAQKVSCSDGPPKNINPSTCCQKANSFDQNVLKTCFTQFASNPARPGKGLQGSMNGLECAFECILNTTKTLDNDRPNPQLLIQRTTATLNGDADWIPVVSAGINYCITQVNSNSAKLRASSKDRIDGRTVCSPTSAFMLGCMFTYEFRNCPSKKWNKADAKCNELKSFFDQCPTPLIN